MNCSRCGNQVQGAPNFCPGCGAPFVQAALPGPQVVQAQWSSGDELISDKSKVVAGVLQLFLGGFAAGRWYTGHTGLALAQMAACWLTCGIGWVWPFIDGILMLVGEPKDAQGRRLKF